MVWFDMTDNQQGGDFRHGESGLEINWLEVSVARFSVILAAIN